jgi:hypothetical protein
MITYPKDFKPAIEKYDGRSEGNEDHMEGYFPLVMGKAPSPSRVHHLLGNIVSPLRDHLPGDL